MKKTIILLFILVFGFVFTAAQTNTKRPAMPKNVVNFDEKKYPYPMYLLANPLIKKRVRGLLGKKYDDFTDAIDTQEPLEKRGDFLVGTGCAKGLCTIIEAILVIDISNNSITVGMFNSSNNPQFKYYSETPDEKPLSVINQWEKDIAKRAGK